MTRDASGSVETVTVLGRPTMTISRNADGSVASITSFERTVSIDRDGSGRVEGTTVS